MAYFRELWSNLINPSILSLTVWLLAMQLLGANSVRSNVQANPMLQDVGPHGGEVQNENGQDYEVNLDEESGRLDVYAQSIALNANPPQNVGITLYNSDQTGQTVRLKAMDPTPDGFIHYQGQISPLSGPYLAFGIQFDLDPSERITK